MYFRASSLFSPELLLWGFIIIAGSIIAGLAVLLPAFRSYIVKKINKEPPNSHDFITLLIGTNDANAS